MSTDELSSSSASSTRLRWVVFGVVASVIVGFMGLMVWGLLNKTPVTGKSGINRLQRPAPDFTLPLFDNSQIQLAELAGQPVVLNFWASWCPPCRDEALSLERIWRQYKDDGVWIVGVDIQDTSEDAKGHISEFDVTYPNGLDVDGTITVDYGVIGLPTTFFVGRQGIIERRWVGAISEDQLAKWIDELVAGRSPSGDQEGENLDRFLRLDQVP